jgi:hypothetical protein
MEKEVLFSANTNKILELVRQAFIEVLKKIINVQNISI